jgi:hypothetical protein
MPQKIWEFLSARAKPVWILTLLGAFLLCMILFGIANGPFLEKSGGATSIDTHVFYTPGEAVRLLEAYGPEGRKLYFVGWAIDEFFPAVYSVLFALGIVSLLRRSGLTNPMWRWGAALPFAGAVFDYLENLLVAVMLLSYPARGVRVIASVCVVFTLLKFLFFWASLLSLAVLALYPAVRKRIPAAKPVEKKEE